VRLTASGILPRHAIETMLRLLAGFGLAAVFGVAIGIMMGRSRRAEDYLLPLVSIGAPVPGLAYAPLFLLWFGLGNFSSILLVGFVASFPVIFNSWTGVKAVKQIWLRSAQTLGADDRRIFSHVMLPGALPYILTGLRLGLAQAWRILVAVEMLAAVPWGLGWMIFGARELLNTDVMMCNDGNAATPLDGARRDRDIRRRRAVRSRGPQRRLPGRFVADSARNRGDFVGNADRRHNAAPCRLHALPGDVRLRPRRGGRHSARHFDGAVSPAREFHDAAG